MRLNSSRGSSIFCCQVALFLSVCAVSLVPARADPKDAMEEAFTGLSEVRTWYTKFGDETHGKLIRIDDGKIYVKSGVNVTWLAISFLVESQQSLIYEFQKRVKQIQAEARPLTGAELVEQVRDRVEVEKIATDQDLRVWTDLNNKTLKARLTSADRFEIHLEYEGKHTRVPTWAISTVDLEYVHQQYGVDESRPFPAASILKLRPPL